MANRNPKPIPPLTQKDIQRFWSKVDKTPGQGPQGDCWLWTDKPNEKGYGHLTLTRDGKSKAFKAHRISYFMHYGNTPKEKSCVLHSCDFPQCIRPTHLWAGTTIDNNIDRVLKGRSATGERNGRHTHPERTARGHRNGRATHPERTARGSRSGATKLSEDTVLLIRSLCAQGQSHRSVARRFGLGHNTVNAIVARRTWKHI